jgi:hypothetical protein
VATVLDLQLAQAPTAAIMGDNARRLLGVSTRRKGT